MTTKRKPSKATYQRLTDKQLVTLIRKWQKKYAALAKKPAGKLIQGWTPAQIRSAFARELKIVAAILRIKTLKKVDAKLTELKTQHAKHYGYAKNSPLATNATIKRLLAKRRQVLRANGHLPLATIVAALKIESFKNPTFKQRLVRAVRKAKAKRVVRKAKRTVKKAIRKAKSKHAFAKVAVLTSMHKAKTKSLKKEIKKLQQRNAFMRAQVAKFRKEVAQMERHYGSLKSVGTPRLRLVSNKKVGQDVSNIVRFSNALSNAVKPRTFG